MRVMLAIVTAQRPYLTPYSAGLFKNELTNAPKRVNDPTNQPNAFQGALRFAWLDLDALAKRIKSDLAFRAQGITATASLAVTCIDQMPEVTYIMNGKQHTKKAHKFIADLKTATGLEVVLKSSGPARDNVMRHNLIPARESLTLTT